MQKWLEKNLVPFAAKIGSEKHLLAISHAFIAMLPVTMAGSFAVLLNSIFRDWPATLVNEYNASESLLNITKYMTWLITTNGNVWYGTLAVISLVFVFALGYNVTKAYGAPALSGGLIAFSAFVVTFPVDWKVGGGITLTFAGSGGLFTAMLVGLSSAIVFSLLMKKGFTIKMPEGVPPAVSQSFAALIPGVIVIFGWAFIAYLFTYFFGDSVGQIILDLIQKPLLGLSQGIFSVLLTVILVQLFWFFGLHGTNVLAPVLESVYGTAQLTNINDVAKGVKLSDLDYIWTRGSFDAYAWMGGAGATILLIAALLVFSKRNDQKTVGKLGLAPGIFNINEPVLFGLPIVLNTIYVIPFILAPLVMTIVGYSATAIGIVPPVHVAVPWTTPPVLNAFLATGGSPMAAVIALINIGIGFAIWAPFVIVSNKMEVKETQEEETIN